MDLAARRPHITAGVALASAAVIAAGPMTQHLPKFDVAHPLPQVSVSDINLTDAASSMMDLFAGVENQLASLAGGGAAAATVPAAALTDFINPAGLPLPIQTWINTFQTAGTSLQTVYNNFMKLPFPVLNQVAANGVSYADAYLTALQATANGFSPYLLGTGKSSIYAVLNTAWGDFTAGNVTGGMATLAKSLTSTLLRLQPMINTLQIPSEIVLNLGNALAQLPSFALTGGEDVLIPIEAAMLGSAVPLQGAVDAFNAGDPVGLLTNLADVPGQTVNGFLNGALYDGGVIKGLITYLSTTFPKSVAGKIVAPGAVNIAKGGSLTTAIQNFGTQLINGWPAIFSDFSGGLGAQLTAAIQNLPSVLANLPSALMSNIGYFASHIGTLLINLLKLL